MVMQNSHMETPLAAMWMTKHYYPGKPRAKTLTLYACTGEGFATHTDTASCRESERSNSSSCLKGIERHDLPPSPMEDMRLITSIRRPNIMSTIFWTKDFYAAAA